jgi:acid phosphatase
MKKHLLTGLLAGVAFAGAAVLAIAQTTSPAPPSTPVPQNDLLNATLWMSNSVESRANALAVYALARIRLDQALADKTWSALDQKDAADKPLAIILDLDETVLDNNLYETWLIKQSTDYASATYDAWTRDMQATAIAGAIDFLQYADSKGVKLFYVTNREATQEEATRRNMEKLGAPMGGNVDTFLMSREKPDWTSKKGTRRDFVAKDYRVVMLFGDNYGDFSDDAAKSETERMASFEANKAHFTRDWFVIANPEYGSFESAPFNHNFSLPADTRRKMKIDALPSWKGPPAK